MIDLNDCVPKFSQESYDVSVKEDVQVGLAVLKVNATDDDIDGEIFSIYFKMLYNI